MKLKELSSEIKDELIEALGFDASEYESTDYAEGAREEYLLKVSKMTPEEAFITWCHYQGLLGSLPGRLWRLVQRLKDAA